jgi:hypothetical protein
MNDVKIRQDFDPGNTSMDHSLTNREFCATVRGAPRDELRGKARADKIVGRARIPVRMDTASVNDNFALRD